MAGCHRGANVDNLAHSLAGAALAAAGLGRKTALPRKAFNANAVLRRMGVGRNYLYAFGAY